MSAFRASALLALVLAACTTPALAGTDLQKRPAPDFTLTDGPTGEVVSLSALRGKVVVLTFLYTTCPDVCPLTAEKLRDARARVGAPADLALVAVSVDPRNDTPQATREFIRAHRLEGAMRFLVGDQQTLARVWQLYGVAAIPDSALTVQHNDAIYLIDKQGRSRSLVHSDIDVDALAASLRILLGESRLL
ncbi:MAG TPA: SCO family protein [Candidatus Dormibacteraeota bacterium]|nr:SCO family protein [Candidatus Dormibacteraeota bacterium]